MQPVCPILEFWSCFRWFLGFGCIRNCYCCSLYHDFQHLGWEETMTGSPVLLCAMGFGAVFSFVPEEWVQGLSDLLLAQ